MSNDKAIAARLNFLRLDAEQRALLREMRPFVGRHLPRILDEFYAHISEFPETNRLFADAQVKAHAKNMQLKHWNVILAADYDAAYVDSVTRIGETHNRLGLEPRWYIGGYAFILGGLIDAIENEISSGWFGRAKSQASKAKMLGAVTTAAMLDMDLAITVYLDAGKRDKHETLNRNRQETPTSSSREWPAIQPGMN